MFLGYKPKELGKTVFDLCFTNGLGSGTYFNVFLMSGPMPADLDTVLHAAGAHHNTSGYNGSATIQALSNLGCEVVAHLQERYVYLPVTDGVAEGGPSANTEFTIREFELEPTWFIMAHSNTNNPWAATQNFYRCGMFGTLGTIGSGADMEIESTSPLSRNISLGDLKFNLA